MKLYYYKDGLGNFGDDLNPLVWYSLYPEVFWDQSRHGTVLGIGTLINDQAPADGSIFVWGSGVGYNKPVRVDGRWRFVFLRGPLSARALGVPEKVSVTDPAILVKRIFNKRPPVRRGVAFMPHHASMECANWREVCDRAGFAFLDPAADVSETLHVINSSELVVAEAMHAAIVADALRVPWVPVKAYPHILDFKWQDWSMSLNLVHKPHELPALWDVEQFNGRVALLKSDFKRRLIAMGVPSSNWTPPLPKNNRELVMDQIVEKLQILRRGAEFQLSSDIEHERALGRVEEVLSDFMRS